MTYQNVYKAVHEEQLKKEASVKKLAWFFNSFGKSSPNLASTLRNPANNPYYLPGQGLNEAVPRGAGKGYLQALSKNVAKAKPIQEADAFGKDLEQSVNNIGTALIAPGAYFGNKLKSGSTPATNSSADEIPTWAKGFRLPGTKSRLYGAPAGYRKWVQDVNRSSIRIDPTVARPKTLRGYIENFNK